VKIVDFFPIFEGIRYLITFLQYLIRTSMWLGGPHHKYVNLGISRSEFNQHLISLCSHQPENHGEVGQQWDLRFHFRSKIRRMKNLLLLVLLLLLLLLLLLFLRLLPLLLLLFLLLLPLLLPFFSSSYFAFVLFLFSFIYHFNSFISFFFLFRFSSILCSSSRFNWCLN
jgi:Predicted membrane-associated HD superfamily hydrolase